MPEIKEEQLDNLAEAVKSVNDFQTKMDEELGTIKADAKENHEKALNEVKKIVDEMQKEKQASAALAQQQKEDMEMLQKSLLANPAGDKDRMKSAFKEYDQHLGRYFRKNIPVPEEDVERICRDIATKATFGVDESKMDQETKDLVAGSNVDGGFFLTTDRSNTMSMRIFETSPIRPLANIQTTSSDVWETLLDDDEPDAGWVGEVSSRPDTDTAEVGLIKIPIHEMYAQPRATQKMIDDAGFDIVAWHQGKVTRKFSRFENSAFVVGDGSQKPKGFLTYSAWAAAGTYERNAVEQYTSAASGTIDADDLISLQGLLTPDYEINSQWAMNRNTLYNTVFKLKDSQGRYLINPMIVAQGGGLTLLGRPVNLFEDMVNVSASSLSIALADWREFYTIVDRMGIRVLRDPYTAKPYVKFYTTKRVGGAVTNYEAGKILKTKA